MIVMMSRMANTGRINVTDGQTFIDKCRLFVNSYKYIVNILLYFAAYEAVDQREVYVAAFYCNVCLLPQFVDELPYDTKKTHRLDSYKLALNIYLEKFLVNFWN